jgi:FixJ family two-component response regulator
MKNNNPSMVLLDYYLPGEKAETIVSAVKNIKGEIPIVVMSANFSISQDIKKMGANEFMKKPFSRDTLMQVVTKYIH